jgi:hypothetical protein
MTRVQIKLRLMLPKFYFGQQFSEFCLDHIKPHVYFDRWSIQPFNAQARRMAVIWQIARVFRPTVGIETGTFLGSSTPYLATMVEKVLHTIEIDEKTFSLAKERFQKNNHQKNINLVLGDSVIQIEEILSSLNPNSERVLAYLDAHWYDAIPTTDEIKSLIAWGGSWVAIIDDFKIETDSGYKFDSYGNVEIGKDILPLDIDLCLFIPNIPSQFETGRRKGTGYVCMKKDEQVLSSIPELTKFEL